tara:strand:- start:103 stop:972 length:870 start_codon:yes stop_codon:yes gene_type:complete
MPDNKPPAFFFYAGDFLSNIDVAFMDMELRGVYITLLAYSWLEIGLPDNDRKIRKITQAKDDKTWKRYKDEVLKACFVLEDGIWYQPRQERERKRALKKHQTAVETGRKNVGKRWNGRGADGKFTKRRELRANKDSIAIATEIEKEFENEFWVVYPRKVRKKDALKTYKSVRKNTEKDVIIAGIKNHLKGEWAEKEMKYIPHPSTWLNAEGFYDDASTQATGKPLEVELQFVCPVCGRTTKGTRNSYNICRRHTPSMEMVDESKALLDDVLLQANMIREELGLDLIAEK